MAEEKIEKGVISEEALEEIAGGLNISKDTLKKVAIGAGVTVLGLGGYGLYKWGEKKGHDDEKIYAQKNSVGNKTFVDAVKEAYNVGNLEGRKEGYDQGTKVAKEVYEEK